MIEKYTTAQLAHLLYEAQTNRVAISPLSELEPGISVKEAYEVQMINVRRAIKAGARISGKKIGLTSLAMQQMLNVNEPDYGHLFDTMDMTYGVAPDSAPALSSVLTTAPATTSAATPAPASAQAFVSAAVPASTTSPAPVDTSTFESVTAPAAAPAPALAPAAAPADILLQPKVEGEIAFVLGQDVAGPGVTPRQVLESTDYVVAALEIVDSRIRDWKITLADTVADNASSGCYVLGGKRVSVSDIALPDVQMVFYKNGLEMNRGSGAAVLGDPAFCVAWLANKLWDFGVTLKKGEVVLSGALSAAIAAERGDVFKADMTGLGSVEVRFF
ncbi:MAG: fumarylacetoacetate hydrolase family protein [Oscillospiraceae bacterium]|nr:fumarylacetoacetate hydrolase family protein [Oscillospiraceae bacterium]